MVKHVISDKKGLVQESGAGIRIDSCITSGYNAPVAHYNVVAGLSTGTGIETVAGAVTCLLYTSPSPRDLSTSRMPSSA